MAHRLLADRNFSRLVNRTKYSRGEGGGRKQRLEHYSATSLERLTMRRIAGEWYKRSDDDDVGGARPPASLSALNSPPPARVHQFFNRVRRLALTRRTYVGYVTGTDTRSSADLRR